MAKQSAKHKTLGSLLHYFEGMEIAVELKDGSIYQGTLTAADHDMSVTLEDATASTTTASSMRLSIVQIRGSKVRYIHFLDSADLAVVVKQGMDRERSASQKYKRGVRK